MSVALELRRAALAAGDRASFVATGQTGMMIEGWGVAVDRLDQRLRPGHRRVARRGGRGPRRLGHRRGPGLARSPGLLVGDAGAHPRRDAAGDGHGPQAGPRSSTTSTTCPRRRSRSPRCPASSTCTSGSPGSSRRPRSWRSRSTPRSIRDDDEARAAHRSRSRPRPGCRPTTRSGSARTGSGGTSARPSTPCRGSTGDEPDRHARGPAPRPSATRSGSRGRTTPRATA